MLRAAGGSGTPPALAFASLPAAASSTGLTYQLADSGLTHVRVYSDGARWLPVNGMAVLKHMTPAVSLIANTLTIIAQSLLPVGLLQTGDSIRVEIVGTKSGATDNQEAAFYMGTAGTTSDTQLGAGAFIMLNAAGTQGGQFYDFSLQSATTMKKLGAGNSSLGSYGSSGSVGASATTITSAASNALYFSAAIRSSGASNTVGADQCRILWLTP